MLLMSGLGDSYVEKEQIDKAKFYYEKAIELATANGDSNLEDYKLKLKQM